MKTIKTSLLLVLCVLFIQSCKKADQWQENLLDSKHSQTLYSISYGSDNRNQMDIALPKNRTTNTAVVVLIHGGAWVMGDKAYFATDIQKFANEGIACATINYRFASDIKGLHNNEIVADIRKAIDFISSKSEAWQVSPNRFGLGGHSAGGLLAMITAYTKNEDGKIKASASWAGPIDLIDSDQLKISGSNELFKFYVGHPLNSSADTTFYKEASPYWMLNSNSVPTLLIHGTLDPGVPHCNAVKMKQKLDNLGVQNSFLSMEGAYHIWTGQHLKQARSATLYWFETKL